MLRCGHASRKAKARPCESRPITSGISSSMAFRNFLRRTRELGRARYQKPNIISESGVCAWVVERSLMGAEWQITTAGPKWESGLRWRAEGPTLPLHHFKLGIIASASQEFRR